MSDVEADIEAKNIMEQHGDKEKGIIGLTGIWFKKYNF